ncbi:MAG: universal stress protein [Acidobacteriota bacterium]
MITLERILCPVDFSDFSRRALRYASALAQWYEAEVRALYVHAVVAPVVPIAAVPEENPYDSTALVDDARRELDELLKPLRASGAAVSAAVGVGLPVGAILDDARAWPADLLVMGTHGRSGVERLLLGSVTEKVLRKSPCPVLTVHGLRADAVPDTAPFFQRIVCPVDFSEASLSALEYAFSLAQESGGCLALVNVVEGLDHEPLTTAHYQIPEYQAYLVAEAEDRLRALVPAEAVDWCTPDVRVSSGKAYSEILRVSAEMKADLVVMGVLGRNAVDLALFGSTAHHVVRAAECPVLVIRPRAS